jgi:hypothetical protein
MACEVGEYPETIGKVRDLLAREGYHSIPTPLNKVGFRVYSLSVGISLEIGPRESGQELTYLFKSPSDEVIGMFDAGNFSTSLPGFTSPSCVMVYENQIGGNKVFTCNVGRD